LTQGLVETRRIPISMTSFIIKMTKTLSVERCKIPDSSWDEWLANSA
jgi:hypothetical protein